MQAIFALEDGRIFRGEGYGAPGESQGEVVFNTSLTGYQEIATDPSYAGQIVVLTNPQIGNYGTNQADNESSRPYIEGLIVREFSAISSNWRSEQVTDEYMERYAVPVLGGDRYACTGSPLADAWRHARRDFDLRDQYRCAGDKEPEAFGRWMGRTWREWYQRSRFTVSIRMTFANQSGDALLPNALLEDAGVRKHHVVAYDFGIKQNILRMLTRENCRVTVVPAETSAEDVLGLKPDGVFLVEWAG